MDEFYDDHMMDTLFCDYSEEMDDLERCDEIIEHLHETYWLNVLNYLEEEKMNSDARTIGVVKYIIQCDQLKDGYDIILLNNIMEWVEDPSERLMTLLVDYAMNKNEIRGSADFLSKHRAKMYLAKNTNPNDYQTCHYYVKKMDPNEKVISPFYSFA